MSYFGRMRHQRLIVACVAAIISVGIAIAERHIRVVIDHPATYGNVLQHKCGVLMMACIAWAALEAVLAFALHRSSVRLSSVAG